MMNFRQIAARNVWQNRQRYLAYIFSAAFSAMIFFMYSALIFHPDLQGGYAAAGSTVKGMKAAAVVIAAFTFLFLLYSNSAFIRSRKKEFGLFTLMGVTRGQLVRMVLWENAVIGAVALGLGLSLGLLFLKLFFMAVSALLHLPSAIPFYVSARAWLITLAVFCSFFLVVALFSLMGLVTSSIIQLIRAGRQPKAAPTFSRWKAAVGLILMGGGYIWASIPIAPLVAVAIIPVTLMVSIGTFFVLRESSIALLQWLHRSKPFFYRTGPFLTVSQLTFKMQDNSRVLSAVAITVAVILSAMGTIASLYTVVGADTIMQFPRNFQMVTTVPAAERDAIIEKVEAIFEQHGLKSSPRRDLVTRKALLTQTPPSQSPDATLAKPNVVLVPYSVYAEMRGAEGSALPLTNEQETIEVFHFTLLDVTKAPAPSDQILTIDGEARTLHVVVDPGGPLFNPLGDRSDVLVISDSLFQKIMSRTPIEAQMAYTTWDSADWKGRAADGALKELRQVYPSTDLTATLEAYQAMIGSFGMALFVGLFVTLVFFAASCSILYFRLFTEMEEDRRYFRRLQEVGVSQMELRRISLQQTMVIFFVPFLLGLVHSTFAMRALGTLLNRSVLHVGWLVALGYLVLYALFFAITYAAYWRSLSVGNGVRERVA